MKRDSPTRAVRSLAAHLTGYLVMRAVATSLEKVIHVQRACDVSSKGRQHQSCIRTRGNRLRSSSSNSVLYMRFSTESATRPSCAPGDLAVRPNIIMLVLRTRAAYSCCVLVLVLRTRTRAAYSYSCCVLVLVLRTRTRAAYSYSYSCCVLVLVLRTRTRAAY